MILEPSFLFNAEKPSFRHPEFSDPERSEGEEDEGSQEILRPPAVGWTPQNDGRLESEFFSNNYLEGAG